MHVWVLRPGAAGTRITDPKLFTQGVAFVKREDSQGEEVGEESVWRLFKVLQLLLKRLTCLLRSIESKVM